MRRSIGLVLVGLGVLMLVLAPMSRWYAYPRLAVVSNDVAERVSTGSDVTVLDLGAVVRQEPEVERVTDVRSVRRIIPDQGDSGGDVAVWDTSVTNFDALGTGATPEENVLSYFEERVAFDRHTAVAVDGHDQYYTPTGERADRVETDHQGYYFKLPFGTEQRSYPFWDSTIQDTRPLEFQNETTLEGLPVYVFEQVIEPTPVSALEIPGALFGQTGSIVADRIYSTTRTLWVEPQTGAIIKGQEAQDSYLDFEGTRGPTIVQGTLAYTADQVTANVDEFAGSAEELELVRTTVPIAAGAGGLVLVVLGLLLARRGSYHGKRRAPLPDDGDDGGYGGGGGGGGGYAEAAPGVVTRPAPERTPLQQRPRTRTEQPARSYEPPRVAPYEAPRYDEPRHQDPAADPARYDDSPRRRSYAEEQYARQQERFAAPPEVPARREEPATRHDEQRYAERQQYAEQRYAERQRYAEQQYGEEQQQAEQLYAEQQSAEQQYAEPVEEPAAEHPATERSAAEPPAAERQERPLPRRPQASAVRPPVGRPHVQPSLDQPQAQPSLDQDQPQSAAESAELERTRADLARLERARVELARFAQAHPDLAGTGSAAGSHAASQPAEADAAVTPSAPDSDADEPQPAAGTELAETSRPAAPAQSGRRRARDDDGLFDEFDEDGQSAGSLHRY